MLTNELDSWIHAVCNGIKVKVHVRITEFLISLFLTPFQPDWGCAKGSETVKKLSLFALELQTSLCMSFQISLENYSSTSTGSSVTAGCARTVRPSLWSVDQ